MSIYKKIFVFLFVYLISFSSFSQSDQFFLSDNNNSGQITCIIGEIKNNQFSVDLMVDWVDSKMQTVPDSVSVVVIDNETFSWSNKDYISCVDFDENTVISFNSKIRLNFAVVDAFTGGNVVFSIKPKFSNSAEET